MKEQLLKSPALEIYYSAAVFNLDAVVLCSFGCRAIPTFWRPKSCKKPRHTEKSVSPRFAQELLCQAISFGRASFVT
jgi:hypothetical protein